MKLENRQLLLKNLYTVGEAARILKATRRSVLTWCENGDLQGIPQQYGQSGRVTYLIPKVALELFQQERRATKTLTKTTPIVLKQRKPMQMLSLFLDQLESGAFNGIEYSRFTIDYYKWHLERFLEHCDYLTAENLEAFFSQPFIRKSTAQKEKMHRAAVCFAKFLIKKGLLAEEELGLIQQLKPKAKDQVKRNAITEEQVINLIAFAKKNTALNYAILCVFLGTGMRASELCNIELDKVDLESNEMWILRKGGRYQKIGFNQLAKEAIVAWLKARPEYAAKTPGGRNLPWLFLSNKGTQLRRDCAGERMVKMSEKIGIHANPHAIRRAYVTINANKGRSLEIIKDAVGHTRINTTMKYIRTTEKTVVDAMKAWDY